MLSQQPSSYDMSSSDLDYALALSLQEQVSHETQSQEEGLDHDATKSEMETLRYDPKLIVDERWELLDPHPNVHDLFVQFDAMFFDRRLVNAGVEVRWSPRMTLCAGVCSYEGRGGLCSVRLSVPLLKLRPRKDLVETLLHEMIHALLFVTENNKDHDGHGPNFCHHMNRINSLTGANITIYHTFHEEVKQYRQHWWRCNGPCKNRPPFYGWVKRAMNRAPSPRDPWWNDHQLKCGGSYTKVKEPEGYGEKKTGKKIKTESAKGKPSGVYGSVRGKGAYKDIKEMLKQEKGGEAGPHRKSPSSHSGGENSSRKVFSGSGHSLVVSNDAKLGEQPTTQDERRQKLLEAVEKRQLLAQNKGVKRKSSSSDIRPYLSTPLTHNGKKPNLDSSTPPEGHTVTNHHTQHVDPMSEASLTTPSNTEEDGCYVIAMATSGDHRVIGEDQDNVIVIDDDSGDDDSGDHGEDGGSGDVPVVPLGMCPVCGRVDIPHDIINIHVAYCLDEDA